MEKDNRISYRLFGRRALFTMPEHKTGGEKFSYQVPTYQALKGITESIYWKPTIIWQIERLRVINPIRTETQGVKPIKMSGGNDLAYYTYLKDVEYEVVAKFVWNENRDDLTYDRNENKHFFMAKRSLEKGGRRDIFLGTRECQGYVVPCEYRESGGAYHSTDELSFGLQFHSFTYPDEATTDAEKGKITANFWIPVMRNGEIEFIKPHECKVKRALRDMQAKNFKEADNFRSVADEVER